MASRLPQLRSLRRLEGVLWHRFRQHRKISCSRDVRVTDNSDKIRVNEQFAQLLHDNSRKLLRNLGPQDQNDEQFQGSDTNVPEGKAPESGEPGQPASGPERVKGSSSDNMGLSIIPIDDDEPAGRLHHFDTQKVFSSLKYGGCTPGQAGVLMSTVRDMLDEIVTDCNERGVLQSVAANEAYLFDAAASELRNEVRASRYTQSNQSRAGLARLQRDVEILEHEAGEMVTLLRADMDMDINERKNTARNEENNVSLRLQELTNKINVHLASELKSEIEDLRWQITRRGIVAIAFVAATILWLSRAYASDDTNRATQPLHETKGSEYAVPVLSSSVASDDVDDVAVAELDYEPEKEIVRARSAAETN